MQLVDSMEQRVVELETRLSFQEDTLNQLNDTLVEQSRVLDRVLARLQRLDDEFRRLDPGSEQDPGIEPPPPHY